MRSSPLPPMSEHGKLLPWSFMGARTIELQTLVVLLSLPSFPPSLPPSFLSFFLSFFLYSCFHFLYYSLPFFLFLSSSVTPFIHQTESQLFLHFSEEAYHHVSWCFLRRITGFWTLTTASFGIKRSPIGLLNGWECPQERDRGGAYRCLHLCVLRSWKSVW